MFESLYNNSPSLNNRGVYKADSSGARVFSQYFDGGNRGNYVRPQGEGGGQSKKRTSIVFMTFFCLKSVQGRGVLKTNCVRTERTYFFNGPKSRKNRFWTPLASSKFPWWSVKDEKPRILYLVDKKVCISPNNECRKPDIDFL